MKILFITITILVLLFPNDDPYLNKRIRMVRMQIENRRIESLGYKNIKLKYADGYYGWQEAAPFDAIVVTAAAEYIPPPLLEQLKDGGKMIIPIGTPFLNQNLVLVEKSGKDFKTKSLLPVRFVPFTRKK